MQMQWGRLKKLWKKRSLGGWILLILGEVWKRLGDWQTVEWLIAHVPKGLGEKIYFSANAVPALVILGILWLGMALLWPNSVSDQGEGANGTGQWIYGAIAVGILASLIVLGAVIRRKNSPTYQLEQIATTSPTQAAQPLPNAAQKEPAESETKKGVVSTRKRKSKNPPQAAHTATDQQSKNAANDSGKPSVAIVQSVGNRTKIWAENNLIFSSPDTSASVIKSTGDDAILCATQNEIFNGRGTADSVTQNPNVQVPASDANHAEMDWWLDVLNKYLDFASKKDIAGLQSYFDDLEKQWNSGLVSLPADQQKTNQDQFKALLDGLIKQAADGTAPAAAGAYQQNPPAILGICGT